MDAYSYAIPVLCCRRQSCSRLHTAQGCADVYDDCLYKLMVLANSVKLSFAYHIFQLTL